MQYLALTDLLLLCQWSSLQPPYPEPSFLTGPPTTSLPIPWSHVDLGQLAFSPQHLTLSILLPEMPFPTQCPLVKVHILPRS